MQTFSRRMPVSRHHIEATVPFFRRFVAAVGVALVLLLGASAASPGLHHHLHGDNAVDASADNCAIVLFASGVTLAFGAVAVAAPRTRWEAQCPRVAPFIFVVSPRYLRQPERGPPVS